MSVFEELQKIVQDVDIEFEESKWRPVKDADVQYIDFKIVRDGMDKILEQVGGVEKQLQDHIEKYPETALIGWAPNPDVAKEFDEWIVGLKKLLGVEQKKEPIILQDWPEVNPRLFAPAEEKEKKQP